MNAIGDTGKFMQRARATWKRGQSHPLRLCSQILKDDYVEPYVNPGYGHFISLISKQDDTDLKLYTKRGVGCFVLYR